jgi:hypothetical protein
MTHSYGQFSASYNSEEAALFEARAALSEYNPIIRVERVYADYRKPPKLLLELKYQPT